MGDPAAIESARSGRRRRVVRFVSCTVPFALLAMTGACDDDSDSLGATDDLRARFNLEALGPTPYPPDNPPRQERIALGRLLFFDPILAGENDVSCGVCHYPPLDFGDRRQFGAGVSGRGVGPDRLISSSAVSGATIELEPRNTPTVFNAAMAHDETGAPSAEAPLFWDGRARGLEALVQMPIADRVEMRGDAYPGTEEQAAEAALDSVLARLREIPEYTQRFRLAFPDQAAEVDAGTRAEIIDPSTYSRALASYVRELVTRNSAYDRFVNGDLTALTDPQKRGLELFYGKAKCSTCHGGAMFSDFELRVVGAPQEGLGKDLRPGDDLGREEVTQDAADRYKFRTPTLRNVELTPPYMHDGAFETLDQVVRFFNDGAQPRHPNVTDGLLDPGIEPLGLTDLEINDLVEFMRALTDPGSALNSTLLEIPEGVPSGLTSVFGVLATRVAADRLSEEISEEIVAGGHR